MDIVEALTQLAKDCMTDKEFHDALIKLIEAHTRKINAFAHAQELKNIEKVRKS